MQQSHLVCNAYRPSRSVQLRGGEQRGKQDFSKEERERERRSEWGQAGISAAALGMEDTV